MAAPTRLVALASLALAASVAAAAATTTTTATSACSTGPVYIDFHSRVVDGGLDNQYGLFAGVGTPSQNQSWWPSLVYNETYVTSTDFCDTTDYGLCLNETHGVFVPGISASFDSQTFQSLDAADYMNLSVQETGTDTLNIFTHYYDPSPPNGTYVSDFPVTVLTNFTADSSPWFDVSGHMGLGPSSTVLSMLYDQGSIASRSFSFYVGNAYARAGGVMNGSLTLGGHDSGRWVEPLYDFDIASVASSPTDGSTPFKVTVESVTLLNADNSTLGTLNTLNESPFDAYLSTAQFPLTLPEDATATFASLTGGVAATNSYDTSFELPSSFTGALSITLSTGLTVFMPNSELRNASNISPISAIPAASNSSTSPSVPVLGASFLSHVYLIAEYSASPPVFHLAEALPASAYVQVVAICDNDNSTLTPVQAVSVSTFASKGVVGAIIGGVIGGIGVSFTLWWCARRYFMHKAHRDFEKSLQEKQRPINRSRNPISAYRRERDVDLTTAESAISERGFEFSKSGSFSSDEEAAAAVQNFELKSPRQQNQHAAADAAAAPSTARLSQLNLFNRSSSRALKEDSTTASGNPYSNVPLSPNTPLPVLAAYATSSTMASATNGVK